MMPTTRLQKPNIFIINDGTNDLEYPIATKKNGERLWRSTKVRIQPGQGELVKHWYSWHSGMGWSKDESRDNPYPPAVYEYGSCNATRRNRLYPEFKQNTVFTITAASIDRVTEMGDYIYAFSTDGTNICIHKVDPSDDSVVYKRTISGWTAPAGQTTEFGGYLYVPSGGSYFKELTTIVGDLTAAWYYDGTNYADNTTVAAANGGTAFTILADHTDDIFYFGAATKFDGVYFDIETAAGSALTMDWEFWNGSAWTDMVSESDGTSGLTVDGWVTWASADQTSWATATPTATSMAGSPPDDTTRFWVRVKTTTATPWTAPTSDWLPISDVWTDGPKTADANRRLAWHMATAGKLLWRVGDNSDPPEHYTINSCAARSSGGSGGPLTYGNWSDTADYIIGKPGRNINSLAELGRWLYVGKEEGMWGSDSSGNQTNALDFVRNLTASTNCDDTIRWLGTLVTTHKTGLWQHTGVSSLPIGIETMDTNTTSVKGGRYTALATAGEWLFVAYLLPSDSSRILAGRPGRQNELPIVWHDFVGISGQTVRSLHISGLTTNPKLWMAVDGATASNLVNIILAQDGSPDPTDSNVTFSASSDIYFPALDWGMPATPKRGHYIEITTRQATGTGGSVKAYVLWDGSSSQVGSEITTATTTQLFWTAGSNDEGFVAQVVPRITGGTNTLYVDELSLYCIPQARQEDAIETVIRIADMGDKQRTGKDAYDELDALVGKGTLATSGVYDVRDPDDPAGGTFKAIVHNIEDTKGEQIDRATGTRYVTVTLRKVVYS